MKSVLLLFMLVFTMNHWAHSRSPLAGQKAQPEEGKKFVESYVVAFNSGEEAMRAFLTENVSKASLEQRSVDVRLQIYHQLIENLAGLALEGIQEITNSSITALMHTRKDGWVLMTFELDDGLPQKMVALRIEDTDAPGSEPKSEITERDAINAIDKFLKEETKNEEFSGSVLIAKDGKTIYKKAFGRASKEFGVRNSSDTRFNLGSINKIFTQVAIGQLLETGKLSLVEPIKQHLPEYPNRTAAEKVTIRQLLDMKSGIGDFFGDKFDATPKDKFRTLQDYHPMFAGESLHFEPGTNREYSNGGYVVLGTIIEKISGQSYYDYVRDHIFKPAGMMNTESYEADAVVPDVAEGYTRESTKEKWKKNIYTRPARGSSAGGGYSTVEDLLKFTIALENNMFFADPSTWSTLRSEGHSGSSTATAAPAQKARTPGRIAMGIFGGAPGINSGVETGIGKGYTAIVLANYDPPAAEQTMKRIREFLKRVH